MSGEAGGGRNKLASYLVGLYVVEVRGPAPGEGPPGIVAPLSENIKLRLTAGILPSPNTVPQCCMRSTVIPVGPSNRNTTSRGEVWENPLTRTRISPMVSASPAILKH